jgi:hypothetical protein
MTNNTNTNFYRSVKAKMTRQDIESYIPYHRGLDINFYPQVEDGHNLFEDPKQRKNINWVDITITASSVNPNILHERNMRDIDEELAIIDSKYGILKDHLTHTDNKRLIHNHQSKESLIKHGVILDHPYLEGENDNLKSKATDVHDVKIPMEEVKAWNDHFERRKAFYKRKMLKEFTESTDEKTNEKMATFKFGYI